MQLVRKTNTALLHVLCVRFGSGRPNAILSSLRNEGRPELCLKIHVLSRSKPVNTRLIGYKIQLVNAV